MELDERVTKLETEVSDLKISQAETKIYTKMILDNITEMKTKIDNLGTVETKKKEPFWDTDTKKAIIKWAAIVILVIAGLLAGGKLLDLLPNLPK